MCGKSACTVRRGEGPKPIGPSYPYLAFERPGSVVGRQRPLGHCSPAPCRRPEIGFVFSCSIPPLFVLSHSLPMVNIMGKLASFGRFLITVVTDSSISLATGHHSPRTTVARHHYLPRFSSIRPATAGSGRA